MKTENKQAAVEVASSEWLGLAKAIYKAGFRSGYYHGTDDTCAYERGHGNRKPDPEGSWNENVRYRIDTDSRFDPLNPEHWADVP